ncbi:alkaline phosphatase D family protein [Sphingomonas sp. 1P06PA]|uniref:alkaline phosphatase D family protein n=1 Tax=Sphingomonas sp. 1P06PA TaxID=554121 RepID=UPI0039A6BEC1
MEFDRRQFIGALGAGALGAPAILRAQAVFRDYPFRLGVAAGDPAPDGFVIWTRLAPDPLEQQGGMPMVPVEVEWEVGADSRFATIAQAGKAIARPELGHAVHVEVGGLQPGRPYWYRFRIGRERSIVGTARTVPLQAAKVRFGVAGCQAYEDGFYTAYRHMAAEADLDFVYHYGDYIYEGRAQPVAIGYDGRLKPFVREVVGGEIYSLDDYRRRYAQAKLDPDLQAAHAAAAWFVTMDDHEIDNNWVQDIDQDDTPRDIFRYRRAAAWQAWYEHMPVRRASMPNASGVQVYRRQRYGDLLTAHFCDTRQFRSDQPCDDGFKPDCPGTSDPKAVVLGSQQEKWLVDGLRGAGTRWNAVCQQIMMMRLDRRTGKEPVPIRNIDSWAAYLAPRDRLLSSMKGLGNVVVLTGDEHQNFAGEVAPSATPDRPVAVEFVSTSISSGGDGGDKRYGTEQIIANSPELKWTNDQRGYLLCDVGRDLWNTQYRVLDKVSTRDGQIATRATATVERGKVKVEGLA